jgi:hypothetical protein
VTMFKEKHYEEEGVLVNRRVRVLVVIMEILARNFVGGLLDWIEKRLASKIYNTHFKALHKSIGTMKDVLENI